MKYFGCEIIIKVKLILTSSKIGMTHVIEKVL